MYEKIINSPIRNLSNSQATTKLVNGLVTLPRTCRD